MNIRFLIGLICLLLLPVGGLAQNASPADSLRIKGEKYHEEGNFKKAELFYRRAYSFYRSHKDTAALLITGVYYGEVLSYRSKMSAAIALLTHLKSILHPANDDSLKSRIESDLGWIYKQKGDLNKALPHLHQSLTYALKAKDSLMIGVSLNNLALAYAKQRNFQQSLESYTKALSIFKKLDNKRSQAYALSNIGNIYKKLGLYDKAFEYYSRSLEIANRLNNVNIRASMYYKLGALQQELGNYDQAFMAMHKSLKYRRQAHNTQEIGSALNQIGTLYGTLGDRAKALEYYRQSLSVWQQVSNPSQLAIANKNIAYSLWNNGQKKEAVARFKKALALKKGVGTPQAIATSLLDLAMIEKSQHNIPAAFRYVRQAHEIADSTGDQFLLKKTARWFGILSETQGKFAKAVTHYKNALDYSRDLDKNEQLLPLIHLANTFHELHSDSALVYGQQAVDIIEENRAAAGSLSQIKAEYFGQYSDFYIDMASWILTYRHNVPRAYKLIELAKARSLTDDLAAAAKRLDESLPEEERLKRARQIANISALYTRLKHTAVNKQRAEIQKTIRDKELAYTSFENRLHQNYSQYKKLENPAPVSLRQVQKMCDSDTAILEYAATDKKMLVFLITRNKAVTHEFSINNETPVRKRSHLSAQVFQFRKAIKEMIPEDSLRVLSKPLYAQLVQPFQKQLNSYSNLIILPSSFLAYLPFEALSSPSGAYLVRQFNIKYVPSMTGFSLIPPPRPAAPQKLLAIANSSAYAKDINTPVLPTADLEIDSVSALFSNKAVLKDKKVTEKEVKKRMQGNYSYIHIAAHSMIDEKNSSLSGIIFDQNAPKKSVDNDGYLRSNEIYRLNIQSNIVVLSACKSGIGQMVSGEGMLGLQRAFFNAGTSAVVVSLWDVYDRPTTHFMQLFYKHLLSDTNSSWSESWQTFLRWVGWDESVPFGDSAVALRKTKLQMLDSPRYRHPVYWAPFIVAGR